MNKEEALKHIEEMKEIIESDNLIDLPGTFILLIGIFFTVFPFIMYWTRGFTFNLELLYGNNNLGGGILISLFIVISICWIMPKLTMIIDKKLYTKVEESCLLHPLLLKTLSIDKPLMIGMYGTMAAFLITGNYNYVFPMVFIFIGIFYCLLSRFMNNLNILLKIAWSYIYIGIISIVFIYFLKGDNNKNYLTLFLSLYFGITFIIIGLKSRKNLINKYLH